MFAGRWAVPLLAHFGRDWSASGLQAARMVSPATSGESLWDWRELILGCHVSSVEAVLYEEGGRMVLMGKGDPLDFGFHALENRVPTDDQASGQEKGWG